MDRSSTKRTRALLWRRFAWALLVAAWVLAAPHAAHAVPDHHVVLDETTTMTFVGGRMALLRDDDGLLDIDAVRAMATAAFEPGPGSVPNFGLSRSTIWGRLLLVNRSERPAERWLTVDNPTLDDVALFVGDAPARIAGRSHPKRARELPRNTFSFRVVVPAGGELPIHLRFRSLNEMHLHVSVATMEALWEHDAAIRTWHFLAIGFLVAMGLYSLLLFASLRDVTYGFYASYVLLIAVWATVHDGSLLMLLPDAAQVMPRWPYVSLAYGSMLSAALFSRRFLDTAQHTPRLDRALLALAAMSGLMLVLALWVLPWEEQNRFGVSLNALLYVANIAAGLRRWRQGFRPALYFILGWGALGAVGALAIASTMGLVPTSEHGISVTLRAAYIADVAFFAVALAATARERGEHIEALRQAGARFVPFAFLSYLGRRELPAVRLGDSTQAEMTVFFSDIRSFTSMVERLTPEQTLELVNNHLAAMTPAISRHGGFVDKYIGDAVMALFERPDEAVRAAIDCHHALEASGQGVRVGIGLHTGPLVMGTVGHEQRLSCTVLGDSVNLAARVESLTKRYGAALLITEQTRAALRQPEAFLLRRVDHVAVKGKAEAVGLYEVLDALPVAERAARQRTVAAFNAAQADFERGATADALAGWRAIGDGEGDPALALALARAGAHQSETLPEGWAGVTQLTSK